MTDDTKDTAEKADTSEQKTVDTTVSAVARAIMDNPAASAAAAAGLATPEVQVRRVLDALPGLVGAIDHAIKDETGKHQPFALIIFAEGTVMHAANFTPKAAQAALIELAKRWETGQDEAQLVTPEGPVAVDKLNDDGTPV